MHSKDDRTALDNYLDSVLLTVRAYAEELQAGRMIVDEIPLDEYPLEIVNERGREYAVVICTGGPHIEIVADGQREARLAGYWWGESAARHAPECDTVLNYFINRDED